ncbi:MAG: hypothetical protein EOP45_07735 [Sphingobacteriaceae bacterium]|nr:MAG: hypothetical protein EOP45_07735 [Sphingobacteriaceae bacterium]
MKLPQSLIHIIHYRIIQTKAPYYRALNSLLEGFEIGTDFENRPSIIEIIREEAIAAYNTHMRLETIDEILTDLDNQD